MAGNGLFIKSSNRSEGLPLYSILGLRPASGEIGIEIEVEGNKFRKESIPSPWKYVKDGSLRGQDNAEYVLRNPILFTEVRPAIETLWNMFANDGSVLDESNRTSVHVHLNAQNFFLDRLCVFAALYYSVEEILTEWCGDHRVGNLFCLRAKDAPASITALKRFIQNDGAYGIRDSFHYAGLNIHALLKHGSIEIRALRGVKDPQIILDWVEILQRIYTLSGEFTDPRTVCEGFSSSGPFEYLRMVLGDKTETVLKGVSLNDQEVMESLYDGIRIAQDLCFCRDWSLYKKADVSSNPFGRNRSRSTASLSTAGLSVPPEIQAEFEAAYQQLAGTGNQPSVLVQASPPTPYDLYNVDDLEEEDEEDWDEDEDEDDEEDFY